MEKIELTNASGNVFYTVEYDTDHQWLYSNWIGFVSVEDVKQGCNAGLDAMIRTRCLNLLNDNRQLTGPWKEANEWIAQDWMPRALQAGLKNFAHVASPSIFAEYSAKDLETRLDEVNFVLKIFKDVELAKAWLSSQIGAEVPS